MGEPQSPEDLPPVLLTADTARACAGAVAAAPLVAVDTEFHAESRYRPELLLVQIHVPGVGVYLLDPLDTEAVQIVGPALGEAGGWLVHGGRQDLRLLLPIAGRVPDRVVDTQVAAALVEPVGRSGLDGLMSRFLGRTLCKDVRMADWSRRPLPPEQLTYAAEDVRWLPALWRAIEARGLEAGRTSLQEEACAEAREEALHGDPADEAFRHAARDVDLDPAEASVLRELVRWREGVAARSEKPPHFLVGDVLLREVARLRPASVDVLARHRRLSERLVTRYGREIVAVVRQGLTQPQEAQPHLVRPGTAAARRLAWLEGFANALGVAGGFAGSFVLPRHRLEPLAHPGVPSRATVARALGPWRNKIAGDELFAATQGTVALSLAVDDVTLRPASRIRDKDDAS